MTVKNFVTGATSVTVDSTARAHTTPQQAQEVPGGLYPMRTAAYEMDEYRLMAGWPVPVPAYDIHAVGNVSAAGTVFSVRDDNTAITTGALIRWVADDAYWDETSLEWTPIQDKTGGLTNWTTTVDYAPVLISNYAYRVKDENFVMNALNFDSDTRNHLWADFTASIGSGSGYTVIMVMNPNSSYGNDIDVPYNGLWCPGRATPEGDTFTDAINPFWESVTIQGGYLYLATESKAPTRAISISTALNSNAPLYLAIVFGRPNTVFYAATGPNAIRIKSMEVGNDPGLMDDGVVLGRSTDDVLHTADMALFDVGIYADQLSATAVQEEFAILSSAYGGND